MRAHAILLLLVVEVHAAAAPERPRQDRQPGAGPHLRRPVDAILTRELATLTAGSGRISAGQVRQLAAMATDSTGQMVGSWALRRLMAEQGGRLTPAGLAEAQAALTRRRAPTYRPDQELYRVVGQDGEHTTRNLDLYLKSTGSFHSHTGLQTYSRGWLQYNQRAPLAVADGSRVPATAILNAAERGALEQLTPGQRLDRAVQSLVGKSKLGLQTFEQISTGSAFYQPQQPDWGGVCYSWSHCALDSRQSRLVDVKGAPGARGLWLSGQWLSRADLGKWLMALSSAHTQGEGRVMWYSPEAQDLVKAALGYLTRGGKGFRADIGPAIAKGEIWFQPFVGLQGGKISAVPDAIKQQILTVARQPQKTNPYLPPAPGVEGKEVRLVQFAGRYGDEAGDAHEGGPRHARLKWAAYAVLDGAGKMLQAYLASDPRLAAISGLPVRTSAPVPAELFVPEHGTIDGILKGRSTAGGGLYGPQLEFFVGTVLARGVPGEVRTAFEKEVLTTPGRLDTARVADLARRYPTVAGAYTREQWEQHFAARGLEARRFGLLPARPVGQ